MSEFIRQTSDPTYNKRPAATWFEPVKKMSGQVNFEKLADDSLKRSDERQLERELALKLIDVAGSQTE